MPDNPFTSTMPGGVFDQEAVTRILDQGSEPIDWTYDLHRADRCDRCGAQAFIAALVHYQEGDVRVASILLFCAHHGRQHSVALEIQATAVSDHTDTINAKPSPSGMEP